jgi:hypothetical protein
VTVTANRSALIKLRTKYEEISVVQGSATIFGDTTEERRILWMGCGNLLNVP